MHTAASAPPAIIIFATPLFIISEASPIECAPVAQAVTTEWLGPLNPYWIEILPANRFIKEDIAELEFGPVSSKVLFSAQSKKALNQKTVGIGIYARSGASTVELSKDIKKKIEEVNKNLPGDLNLEIAFNRATYISEAINEVYKTLIIAFILVVIIIYLFLGNLKAVIVPAIALPVSLIATFLGIYLFDLSINIFVLLSFILAIGIITDDSVIMTDAIYRRIENGETPLVAAHKGSKQITFAIIATTLILVAVFLPLIWHLIPLEISFVLPVLVSPMDPWLVE